MRHRRWPLGSESVMSNLPLLSRGARACAAACAAATSLALIGAVLATFDGAGAVDTPTVADVAWPTLFARADMVALGSSTYIRAMTGDQSIADAPGWCRPIALCMR